MAIIGQVLVRVEELCTASSNSSSSVTLLLALVLALVEVLLLVIVGRMDMTVGAGPSSSTCAPLTKVRTPPLCSYCIVALLTIINSYVVFRLELQCLLSIILYKCYFNRWRWAGDIRAHQELPWGGGPHWHRRYCR